MAQIKVLRSTPLSTDGGLGVRHLEEGQILTVGTDLNQEEADSLINRKKAERYKDEQSENRKPTPEEEEAVKPTQYAEFGDPEVTPNLGKKSRPKKGS